MYLETLKIIAEQGPIGPTRIALLAERKSKGDISRILDFLMLYGLVKNLDGEYIIADPLLKNVLVSKRLRNAFLRQLKLL